MSFAVLIAGALLVAPANVLGQPGEGPPREGGPGMKSSTLGPECDETGFDADYSETLRCAYLRVVYVVCNTCAGTVLCNYYMYVACWSKY